MSEARPTPPAPSAANVQRTLWNVLSNWGGFLLSGFINFLLAPFVVRHLGNKFYGLAVLIILLTGYLGLLDLGVRGAITRYVAKFHSQSDHAGASRLVSSALVLFVGIGAVAILVCALLALVAPSLPIAPEDLAWARALLLLLGPNIAVALLSGVFSGIPMGLQRFDHVNAVGVLTVGLRALAIVAALSAGGGLIAVVWIQLATTAVAALAVASIGFRLYPQLRIRWGYFDREHIRLVVMFTVFSFLLLTFDSGVIYVDSLVAGIFLSAALVTFFSIAANLINFSRAIVAGISKTSTPMASVLESQGNARGLERALLGGASFSSAIILPIAVTFLLRGGPFIGLWMGAQYAELSGKVLWILTLGLIFSVSNQIALATMLGISRHQPLVPVFLVQGAATLVLSIVLVRPLGLVGIAWATTMPYLAVNLLFWPWYVRRVLGVSIRAYAASSWARPLLAVLPFAACTFTVARIWPTPNLVVFFLQTAAILPAALAGFWFLCLTPPERQIISRGVILPAIQALRSGPGSRTRIAL